MEEQRQRQEDEARRTAVASAAETGISSPAADGAKNVHLDIFNTNYFKKMRNGSYCEDVDVVYLSVFGCRV